MPGKYTGRCSLSMFPLKPFGSASPLEEIFEKRSRPDSFALSSACSRGTFHRVSAMLCSIAVAAVLFLPAVSGATALFTDQTSFAAAAGSLTAVDFGPLLNGQTFNALGTSASVSGFTVTAPANLSATSPAFNAGYDYGANAVLTSFNNPGDFTTSNFGFTLTLPGSINALGFTVANTFAGTTLAGDIVVTPAGGSGFTLSAANGPVFFGLTFTQPISSITIANNTSPASYQPVTPTSPFSNLFGLEFATAAVVPTGVPEPSSMLLLATGILGAGCLRKRFRSR